MRPPPICPAAGSPAVTEVETKDAVLFRLELQTSRKDTPIHGVQAPKNWLMIHFKNVIVCAFAHTNEPTTTAAAIRPAIAPHAFCAKY